VAIGYGPVAAINGMKVIGKDLIVTSAGKKDIGAIRPAVTDGNLVTGNGSEYFIRSYKKSTTMGG